MDTVVSRTPIIITRPPSQSVLIPCERVVEEVEEPLVMYAPLNQIVDIVSVASQGDYEICINTYYAVKVIYNALLKTDANHLNVKA